MLTVGVLGAGGIGRHHIGAWKRLQAMLPEQVKLVAASCTVTPLQSLSEQGIGQVSASWEEIVDSGAVNAVDICLPDSFHAQAARRAIGLGKTVVCEKPLSLDGKQSRQLAELAEEQQIATAVCFVYRHVPAAAYARWLVESGQLGDITGVRGSYLQSWMTQETERTWRHDPQGAGVLGDLGAHLVDLASFCSLQGPIVEVKAESSDPVVNHSWLARYGSGVTGTFVVSRVSPGHSNDITLEIDGTQGSVRFSSERPTEIEISWVGRGENELLRIDDMNHRQWLRDWWAWGQQLGYHDLFVHQCCDLAIGPAEGQTRFAADFAQAASVDLQLGEIRKETRHHE